MKIYINIACILIGFAIGYFSGCGSKLDIIETEKVVTKIDTVRETVEVKVPEYRTRYIEITDTLELERIDSIFTDVIHGIEDGDSIPVNVYSDSISDPRYKLKYNISTIGFLNSFNYELETYNDTKVIYKKVNPKWSVSGAVSNELNWKLGLGYQGWQVEGVLGKNRRELFIGKQFNF